MSADALLGKGRRSCPLSSGFEPVGFLRLLPQNIGVEIIGKRQVITLDIRGHSTIFLYQTLLSL